MKEEKIYEIIGNIDNDLITDSKKIKVKKPEIKWIRALSLAACVCILAAAGLLLKDRFSTHKIQAYRTSMKAADYFKYASTVNTEEESGISSDSVPPYAESRYFNDFRSQFEKDGVLPLLSDYKDMTIEGNYNEDGSLYSLILFWYTRGDRAEDYKDLKVTAGYEEVPEISDCIFVEVDDHGNILEPAITVTERDGIQIIAEGKENRDKSLTFQTDYGWYRIEGSSNVSYEDLVKLLDWFFEHPLRFSLFTIEAGDHYTDSNLDDYPDAFSDLLPDAESYGFILGDSYLSLKNGEPSMVEAYYYKGLSEEEIQNADYDLSSGNAILVHWCINTEPTAYEKEKCTMTLQDLTEEYIESILPPDQVTVQISFSYYVNDSIVTIYTNNASEAWNLVHMLQ